MPFTGDLEELAGPVERIVLVASVAELFGLNPPADQVEFQVGELHNMERVSDLSRVRKRDFIDPPVGA